MGAHVGVYCGHGEIIHFEGERLQRKHRPYSAQSGCPPVGGPHREVCGSRVGVRVPENRRLGTQGWGVGAPGPGRWGCRIMGLGSQDLSPALIRTCPASPQARIPAVTGRTCFWAPAKGLYPNGQRPLLRSRSLWRVLHRRGGIDRAALERRVREAMDADPPPYHPTHSNCVHFALRLLGPGPSLDPLQIDRSPISVSAVQLLLYPHRTPPPSGAG